MINSSTANNIAHPFYPVQSHEPSSSNGTPNAMIHHKSWISTKGFLIVERSKDGEKSYGVSSSQRVLSPGLLLKKWDYVNDFLRLKLGLTNKQRQVVLKMLRFWAYYGLVCPSAATLADETEITPEEVAWRASEGLSPTRRRGEIGRATVWRTIAILNDLHLVGVVNRYVLRPHAQISNLYKLDNLLILIAKYLAEHIAHIWPDWVIPYIMKPWPALWASLASPGGTSSPGSP